MAEHERPLDVTPSSGEQEDDTTPEQSISTEAKGRPASSNETALASGANVRGMPDVLGGVHLDNELKRTRELHPTHIATLKSMQECMERMYRAPTLAVTPSSGEQEKEDARMGQTQLREGVSVAERLDAGEDRCGVGAGNPGADTDADLVGASVAHLPASSVKATDRLSNIMTGLWRSAEDQVIELATVLQTIATEPVNWNTMNHHYYARIVGRFQLLADGVLNPRGVHEISMKSHALDTPASSVTYPPKMLPSPKEGEEADVFVQNDDGGFRKVYSSDDPVAGDVSRREALNCEPSGDPAGEVQNGLKPPSVIADGGEETGNSYPADYGQYLNECMTDSGSPDRGYEEWKYAPRLDEDLIEFEVTLRFQARTREDAESAVLAGMEGRPSLDAPCRFGCKDPAAGIYYVPNGCICWPDPVQALCAQHIETAESVGPLYCIVSFRDKPDVKVTKVEAV